MVDLSRLPMGFGFSPTDEQIITILIMIVVDKNPLAAVYYSVIHKCCLFGHISEPSEIWERYGGDQAHGQQLFFLSELKRSSKNISRRIGQNSSRRIGRDGTWSESGYKEIKGNTNPNPIGKIRNFRFENKRKSEDHARWFLDEYSLYDAAAAHDNLVICKMRRNAGENKRKRSNYPNTNNVEEPQEGCFTLITNTDHLVLPLPDESNERKRMPDVACDDDPVNEDMLITNPTNTFSIEEQLAPLDGYQSGIASSENLPPDQMAETLEDVPLRSLGSDRLGADVGGPLQPKDHQNVAVTNVENTYPALDSDHYQMDGNQEEQLPLPTLTTAGSPWYDYEYGGAIEANFQIPSNYDDRLLNLPLGEGTSNYPSELPCDLQLWDFQNVTVTNVENTYPALDGNHEEQLPLPTAGSAWHYAEELGAIEADYQIPSNYDDMVNQQFEDGPYDCCSEYLYDDIELWNS